MFLIFISLYDARLFVKTDIRVDTILHVKFRRYQWPSPEAAT